MEFKANFGIAVTSYETDKETIPIMTHIFWGKDIEQAVSYAKSHLISDLFYSSSFTGEMIWQDQKLKLSYDSKLLTVQLISNKELINQKIIEDLFREVNRVLKLQYESSLPAIINQISLQK